MPAETNNGFDEVAFLDRVSDEYKILQDKIDKIGAFRFTIKGWSVTALIAGSAAAGTSKVLSTVVTICMMVAVMMCFFFWFEYKQVKLSRLFGDRARRLERVFNRIDKRRNKALARSHPVPWIANEIVLAEIERRSRSGEAPQSPTTKEIVRRWAGHYRLWNQCDGPFYLVLFLASFLPLLAQRNQIGQHWRDLMSGTDSARVATPYESVSGRQGRGLK